MEVICERCQKERRNYAKGLCHSCYKLIHHDKEKQKIYTARWKAKHPDYFKNYYLKKKEEKWEREEDLKGL